MKETGDVSARSSELGPWPNPHASDAAPPPFSSPSLRDFMSPDPVVQVQKESHKEHGVAMAMAPNQKGTSVVTLWIFWRREEGN